VASIVRGRRWPYYFFDGVLFFFGLGAWGWRTTELTFWISTDTL
jgi:hypothetical protein